MKRRRRSLADWDTALCAELDTAWRQAQIRAGQHLACKPSCTECCIGTFPITALDAWRLRTGLRELAARDPARAAAVRARAQAEWSTLQPTFPGDGATGVLADEETARDAFFEATQTQPCAALDPATGLCDLYAHRPVSCRTIGPPTVCGDAALPPCRLCFTTATPVEIERARVEPDPGDLEARALATMGEPRSEQETVVAYVLTHEE